MSKDKEDFGIPENQFDEDTNYYELSDKLKKAIMDKDFETALKVFTELDRNIKEFAEEYK